jgi:hypothetical protein
MKTLQAKSPSPRSGEGAQRADEVLRRTNRLISKIVKSSYDENKAATLQIIYPNLSPMIGVTLQNRQCTV